MHRRLLAHALSLIVCAALITPVWTPVWAQDRLFGGTERGDTKSNRFVPRDVLSLVVSAEDPTHLRESLENLLEIHSSRGVKVGNVYVVGLRSNVPGGSLSPPQRPSGQKQMYSYSRAAQETLGPEYGLLEKAGVGYFEVQLTSQIFKQLDINYSPTWIVRHRGKDYVFEGFNNPAELFNRQGEFIRAEQ